jgi:phage-related protein
VASVKIIGKVAVKVMPDTKDFKRTLENRLNKIERQIGDMKVDVIPQVSKTAEKKVKAQMERLQKSLNGKNVNLNPNLRSTSGISAQIAALTRDRTIHIKPDLDQAALAGVLGGLAALSGARVGLDSLREGIERVMEIDRLVPAIALAAVKAVALSTAAIALTGHLFSLGASLAQILPAGLALPGILGGVVIGVGITAAAFADFNKVIPEMQDKLTALQNSLSANFWSQAEGPIRNMIDNLWPAFAAGVNSAATAIGGFFGSLASELSGMDLAPMFDNLVKSVEVFSGYTDNIASIIEKLGTVGASYLPALAGWFGDIIAKFDTWLGTGAKLQAMIDTGITNLQALGSILGSVWSILSGISNAASEAGGTTLVMLAGALERIAATVNSAGFQTGLTSVFEAAFTAMDNLTKNAGPGVEAMLLAIRDLFVQIAPQVGTALGGLIGSIATALANPAVSEGITAMFDGILNAMEMLQGAAGPVTAMLAAIAPIVGALAENIAMVLTNGLDRMAPTFVGIAEAVLPIIDLLGNFLNKALTDLQPLWQTMGENVQKIIEKIGPLIEAIQRLWDMLAPVLIPVLQFVAEVIGNAVAGAINGLTNVINGFVTFIGGFITFITGVFTGDWSKAWEGIKDIFSGIWDIIKGVVEIAFNIGILGIVRKGWTAIKTIFTETGATLKTLWDELWSSIKTRASTLWNQIEVIPSLAMQAIKGFISGAKDDIVAAAQLIWETMVTKTTTKIGELTKIFQDLPGKIKGFLAGAATLLTDIGGDIVQSLIDGVQAAFSKVKAKFKELTDLIPDWKGPRSRDKVLLTPVGDLIIESLIRGLESRYKDVHSSLKGLTNDIASSMDTGSNYRLGIAADLDTSSLNLSSVGSLSATVGAAVAAAPSGADSGNVRIDNITIPLEDLRQLKDLESFLDMLRVRTRKGVIA